MLVNTLTDVNKLDLIVKFNQRFLKLLMLKTLTWLHIFVETNDLLSSLIYLL